MRVLSHAWRFAATVLAAGLLIVPAGTAAVAASSTSNPLSAPTARSAAHDGQGPQFYSALTVDVSGEVDGDVYASGQSVTISGNVTGDVIAAAQTITITGTVNGNVRLAGQSVTISGNVSRSGTVFASTVNVTDTGSFGTDLVGAAGNVAIAGEVGRDVVVGVGDLTIDGSVGGNVTYTSSNDARIAEGAVSGTVEHIEQQQEQPNVEVSPWAVFVGWFLGLLYALVALSIITIAAALLFPRLLLRVTDHLVPSPWKALLVGFVASIAVPMALLALLVSVIGAPLALAGLLVWIVLTLATFVFGAYYIGRLLFRGNQHPVVKALIGGLILIIALQIPWLNILVWIAMVLFGLGAQLLAIHSQRPWRTRTHMDATPPAEVTPTVEESPQTRA
jgi:cytoskeletal protein CcmA (bactofilin family)